ncbi:5'/3'-nucleotidase SurE [Chloroflexota bacterium]
MSKLQILLTNDDGIQSPGLWAAAESLSSIGFVTVAAPRDQSSGMGRSLPSASDGIIKKETVEVGGKSWVVYAVGGTPAQAVQQGVLEIMEDKPDLVVSGINYGENVASGITISGTVGAALEGASFGIPSLAISLQTKSGLHFSHSKEVDFSTAAYFAAYFGRVLLRRKMPFDVDVLKVDVPSKATIDTAWQLTRVSRQRYYEPLAPSRDSWEERSTLRYKEKMIVERAGVNSDVQILRTKGLVSVAPISLDLSSRVNLVELEEIIRS